MDRPAKHRFCLQELFLGRLSEPSVKLCASPNRSEGPALTGGPRPGLAGVEPPSIGVITPQAFSNLIKIGLMFARKKKTQPFFLPPGTDDELIGVLTFRWRRIILLLSVRCVNDV